MNSHDSFSEGPFLALTLKLKWARISHLYTNIPCAWQWVLLVIQRRSSCSFTIFISSALRMLMKILHASNAGTCSISPCHCLVWQPRQVAWWDRQSRAGEAETMVCEIFWYISNDFPCSCGGQRSNASYYSMLILMIFNSTYIHMWTICWGHCHAWFIVVLYNLLNKPIHWLMSCSCNRLDNVSKLLQADLYQLGVQGDIALCVSEQRTRRADSTLTLSWV